MSEQNLMVSPEKLGAEIRELTRQAKAMTLYYGVEIGRRLEAAKSMVPYGGWGAWLKENTEFSQATATRFMRVFNEYGAAQIGIFGAVPESSTLQNLSISNALRLLAVPEDEREGAVIIAAVHECLTNTVKHAKGNELFLKLRARDTSLTVELTNNGLPPAAEIRETGGLMNLRRKVEAAGGTMETREKPNFLLRIELPRGEY